MLNIFKIFLLLISILFSSYVSTLRADWPLEPYQGNLLFSSEGEPYRDRIVAAFCDSVGGVTVVISVENQLFIKGIDLHGHVISWGRDYFLAVPGPDSTTFVGWANYHPVGLEDFSLELWFQRVGADGQGQWNNGGVVLSESYDYFDGPKKIISINPLPDGSVYVLWQDYDVHYPPPNGELIHEGNYHIQRFASDGTEMWEPGGLEPLPDSLYTSPRPGISQSAVLMDSGHVAFVIGKSLIRIRPDGSYVWPWEGMILDSLSRGGSTKFIYRDTADTLIVVSTKVTDVYACYKISGDGNIALYNEIEYDTPGGIGYSFQTDFKRIGDNYFALIMFNELILLDNELNPVFEEIGRHLAPSPIYRFSSNETGISTSSVRSLGYICPEVNRFDIFGEELWTANVFDDTSGVGRVMHALDENGNLFVFWLKDYGDDRDLEWYANVFSPDGDWGQPVVSGVDEEYPESNLPELITLSAYPNPFNASTTITINLQNSERVTIKIFDMLGRRVSTLLNNEPLMAGTHTVMWETDVKGSRPPSGVYFVRATTESGRRFTTKVQHLK
jgi:type IX secretion system substrate protein